MKLLHITWHLSYIMFMQELSNSVTYRQPCHDDTVKQYLITSFFGVLRLYFLAMKIIFKKASKTTRLANDDFVLTVTPDKA